MIRSLSKFFVTLCAKYIPDAFLFAIILTLIVFVGGMIFTGSTPFQMVLFWGNGFWSLLAFAMQMVLVLVTGHVLASTKVVKNILKGIAKTAKTPAQALMINTVVSFIATYINWGFGLIIGALLAKEMVKQVKGIDYRLIVASGYIAFAVWHAGLSGSTQLTIATKGHFLEELIGIIPTTETLFAPFTLVPVAILFVTLPFVVRAMMPPADEVIEVDPSLLVEKEEEVAVAKANMTPAERLENSPVLSMIIGIFGIVYCIWYFATKGFDLNLNIVNFIFLMLGILLHGTPRRLLNAVAEAVKGCDGIILQFPLYAGIMGMMQASGFAKVIADAFVNISTPTTFPMFTFWSAGLINIAIPSGGGQWSVQGPIMTEAAKGLGVSVARTACAVAWGDAWTNLIQPFWALPALGIAGLGAKDIMGYCVVGLIYIGIIVSLCLAFVP